MRKRLVLGDMHGRYEVVHKIYDFEQPDDVIMLGDYVDTHEYISDEDQHEGMKKLCRIRFIHEHTGKGKFIMLMGNHDFHYYYANTFIEKYSGYDYHRAEWACDFFQQMVKCNEMRMVYCDVINKTVYSHAGISSKWLNDNGIDFNNINTYLNDDGGNEVFRFTYGLGYSSIGDCAESSCIWIRPGSLIKNMYVDKDQHVWTQIVGHTPCRENIFGLKVGAKTEVPINEADLILCDNLPKQYIIEWLNDDGTLYSREVVDSFSLFDKFK